MVAISLARIQEDRSSEATDLGLESNSCHLTLVLLALPRVFETKYLGQAFSLMITALS